jgi:hypothetical protein
MALLENDTGKITAADPGTGGTDPAAADNTLPDPTKLAKYGLGILVAVAILGVFVFDWLGIDPHQAFKPAHDQEANFALFAGFYVIAQLIVALMALVGPLLPPWQPPGTVVGDAARAAQTKADRVVLVLGISTVLGVAGSYAFGLFFMTAIGFHVSHTIDAIATGLVVAGGSKPLQDFIATLQNQTTPKTQTQA